jgi:hypothetical protein
MVSKNKTVLKKEYPLSYQKKDTPGESDPMRRFYTSLLKQKESPMAFKWCLERGLIPKRQIEKMVVLYKMKDVKIK